MRYLSALFVLAVFLGHAQETIIENNPDRLFQRGVEAYNAGNHPLAESLLRAAERDTDKDRSKQIESYLSRIQLETDQDPDGLLAIVRNAPGSKDAYGALEHLGAYYFKRENFPGSQSYLSKIPPEVFASDRMAKIRFRLAYCYLQLDQLDSAKSLFREVTYYAGPYVAESHYYAGFIAFSEGEYGAALQHLKDADTGGMPTKKTAPMIARIYLENGSYDELIKFTNGVLGRDDPPEELWLYQGEAQYAREDYVQASGSLEKYLAKTKAASAASTYYKLAYSQEQTGLISAAIGNYKIAALDNSLTGQFSAFRLGELYLESGENDLAINAFESAIREFDDSIAEQARFLAAKARVAGGRFSEALAALRSFQADYPDTRFRSEANDLIGVCLVRTSDYEAAIEHLELTGLKTVQSRSNYQKVTFLKGQQLYNDERLTESEDYLNRSLKHTPDRLIQSRSQLILGDIEAMNGDHRAAVRHYQIAQRFGKEDEVRSALYGLGYAYFYQEAYDRAVRFFEQYLSREGAWTDEVHARLGDTYFVRKQFDRALHHYERASGAFRDYTLFQRGILFYLDSKPEQAAGAFEELIARFPTSDYVDKALYQYAKLRFEQTEFTESAALNSDLIENHRTSTLLPFAILQRALSNINLSNYDLAEADLEKILEDHPQHKIAGDALLALQDLVSRGHEVARLDRFIEEMSARHPDDERIGSIEFEQAKAHYFNQSYARAIDRINQVLSKYPNASFVPDATYYLADSYSREGLPDRALRVYDDLLMYESPFRIRALDKRGVLLMEMGSYSQAVKNFRSLLDVASDRRAIHIAHEGLMQSYFGLNHTDSAIYFANQILEAPWKPLNAEETATIIKSQALLQRNDTTSAGDELIKVMNQSKGELGAKAHFLFAEMQFNAGNHARSVQTLFRLIGEYGSYKTWTDRAYLLLADNYLAQGELLQARATLNSIVDKAGDDQLVTKAKDKLLEIDRAQQDLLMIDEDATKTDTIE